VSCELQFFLGLKILKFSASFSEFLQYVVLRKSVQLLSSFCVGVAERKKTNLGFQQIFKTRIRSVEIWPLSASDKILIRTNRPDKGNDTEGLSL